MKVRVDLGILKIGKIRTKERNISVARVKSRTLYTYV